MVSHRVRALVAAIATLAGLSGLGAAAGLSAQAAGAAVPSSVRLSGSVPTLPRGASVTGATDPTTKVTIDVSVKPRDPTALQAFVDAVSTPGSPQYHHYLQPGQFLTEFGPTPTTLTAIRTWLTSLGLHPGATSADGLLIPVRGSAGDLERDLDVALAATRLPGGRSARIADRQPTVPGVLAPEIEGVIGLSTVATPEPQIVLAHGGQGAISQTGPLPAVTTGVTACAAAQSAGGYTADQLADTYGLSTLYGNGQLGTGEPVGLFELEPFTPTDITAYKSCYGLTTAVTNVVVDGGSSDPQSGEAALDIEDVAGLAPGAPITVFTGPNGGTGPIETYEAMVADTTLKVISTSWGQCEPQMAFSPGEQATETTLFAEAATQGQTVVAASGDSGSSDCYSPANDNFDPRVTVDDPADQPDVTGVGGTSLTAAGSTPTEGVWNDAFGASGGGVSSDFAVPSWQTGPGVGGEDASSECRLTGQSTCRSVPDVAASADPVHGYAIVWGGVWRVAGGTSAAAPLWAALSAVVDQGLATPAGLLNPDLYAAGASAAAPFNDVTTGDNALLAAADGLFPATAAYDEATGWGSPRASLLATDLASPPVCPTVTSVTPGRGTVAGGGQVTVHGTNLSGATAVHFGSLSATFTVSSSTTIVAVAPAGPSTGGTVHVTVTTATGTSRIGTDDRYTYILPGYWLTASDGGLFAFGGASFYGSTGGVALNKPIVGMAPTNDDAGYWLVASDGGIFTFGDAQFYGSTGGLALNKPIVAMAPTPNGRGYWLVASDGGIFSFGNANFYGSTGSVALNRPIVGLATTPSGHGYWLVASDGGIFSFGNAVFYGSTGSLALNRPIVGLATTPNGHGYWLVASDGGIFSFGNAVFYGSTGSLALNKPIVGMGTTILGHGYWLVASDGGIFSFGDAAFYGSTGSLGLNRPIVGMAVS